MKKYRHKQTGWIAIKRCDNEYNVYTKAENFLFQTAKELIENTNDWEEINPEPQEEEIEGYASKIKGNLEIDFRDYKLNRNDVDYEYIDTPARLILNPKKRKEYVRWVTEDDLRLITGYSQYENIFICKHKENDRICKIKITVEDSE